MKKLLITALLVAASLIVAGSTLSANATSKTTPCKTVKFKVTRQVWNAKHTKKITVDVYKLVKKNVKVKGKTKVVYVKEQVYKETKICTAGVSVTSTTIGPVSVPVVTVPVQVTTPTPTTSAPSTTTTTTTSTTTTTTTVPSSTTTTTSLPEEGSTITATTLAPVSTSYPTTCEPSPGYCYAETVFSVGVNASGVNVAPAAGELEFVFDAPATDNDGGDAPWQFNVFTLVTTKDGQTACPLQWQAAEPLTYGWWQADPTSIAMGSIPACTMTDIGLNFDSEPTPPNGTGENVEYACNVTQPNFTIPDSASCPPDPGIEPEIPIPGIPGGYSDDGLVGTPLDWEVTANFSGDATYAPSSSAYETFTVGAPAS